MLTYSEILSRMFRVVFLAALLTAPTVASAQAEYPTRAIKIIVPFPAGGSADTLTRVIAERLAVALAQPVVIENRPGASGNIGAEGVAKAESDGYTLLASPNHPPSGAARSPHNLVSVPKCKCTSRARPIVQWVYRVSAEETRTPQLPSLNPATSSSNSRLQLPFIQGAHSQLRPLLPANRRSMIGEF